MLSFFGQDRALIDANARIRLAEHFVTDFLSSGSGEVALHGLPEGGLAVYPEATFAAMRQQSRADLEGAGNRFSARRSLRMFGALSAPAVITRQGRITIPEALREYAALVPGCQVCVIGIEIGIEIWNLERYRQEMLDAAAYFSRLREQEFTAATEKGERP